MTTVAIQRRPGWVRRPARMRALLALLALLGASLAASAPAASASATVTDLGSAQIQEPFDLDGDLTVELEVPVGVPADDSIIVVVDVFSGAGGGGGGGSNPIGTVSCTDTQSNVYATDVSLDSSGLRMQLFSSHGVAGLAAGETISCTVDAIPGPLIMGFRAIAVSGLADSPLDTSSTNSGVTDPGWTSGDANTSQPDELVVGAHDNGELTADGSFSTFGPSVVTIGYKTVAVSGPYAYFGTSGDNNNSYRALVATYKLAAPVFDFAGFFSPVDNPPVVNATKAGKAIPVRFSLGGDQGLDILADGSPTSVEVPCEEGTAVDAIEETTAAETSGLSYNVDSDTYTYTWKTVKAWKHTCRELRVTLTDGTTHTAIFDFK